MRRGAGRLRGYLSQLLADRERLAAAIPALADWARRDAAPSEEEIDAVRRLLRANDEVLTGLDDDDRAAVQAAIATIRTQRSQLEVSFPAELAGVVRQHRPVFSPPSNEPLKPPATVAERTAAEHTDRLIARRRLDSADKTRRVLAALNATLGAGESLTIAAPARRAAVSRRFIYDHPELRTEAERCSAEAADRHAAASSASPRVTVVSLRADLPNAKATNHRLSTELSALRRRLGQLLGHQALTDLDHTTIDPAVTSHRMAE